MGMLIILKEHLKQLYGLPDSKCRKFVPSEAHGNEKSRPAVRQTGAPLLINWNRMPFGGIKKMDTDEDMKEQCKTFVELMTTEYTSYDKDSEEEDMFVVLEGEDGSQSPSKDGVMMDMEPLEGMDNGGLSSAQPSPAKKLAKGAAKGGRKKSVRGTVGRKALESSSNGRGGKGKKARRASNMADDAELEVVAELTTPDRPKRRRGSMVSLAESPENSESSSAASDPMWE
jgi:hypothetical protein